MWKLRLRWRKKKHGPGAAPGSERKELPAPKEPLAAESGEPEPDDPAPEPDAPAPDCREPSGPASEPDGPVTEAFFEEPELPVGMQVSAASLIGSRKSQQDALYYKGYGPCGLLACVCDGMGGLEAGEKASQLACDGLFSRFEQTRPYDPAAFFVAAANELDEQVAELTADDGEPAGAGTTLVAALVRDGRLWWLSVGDSKIFLVRAGHARCLTTPHTYRTLLTSRLRRGVIDSEEYEDELPRGDALVSYLGMGGLRYIDASPEPLELAPDDVLLLCSDGLYRQFDPEELAGLLGSFEGDVEAAAPQLAERLLERKRAHMDNTSLIMVKWQPPLDELEAGSDGPLGHEPDPESDPEPDHDPGAKPGPNPDVNPDPGTKGPPKKEEHA